jgi:hypothetical protein
MVSTAVRRRVIELYQITRQKAARAGVCLSARLYFSCRHFAAEKRTTRMDNQSESIGIDELT